MLVLFRWLGRQQALVWSVVLGYLFLPSHDFVFLDLPLLPSIDKRTLPPIVIALALYLTRLKNGRNGQLSSRATNKDSSIGAKDLPGFLPKSFLGVAAFLLLAMAIVVSGLKNSDPLYYGDVVIPGQHPLSAITAFLFVLITLIPMLLARKYLWDENGHRVILKVLLISSIGYSLPALFEVRMSPQINEWVYGFFPHSFFQHMRAGGFRPLVFLDHGLLLGIFLACSVLAMAVMARTSTGVARAKFLLGVPYLLVVLFLSKNLGALIIATALLPIVLFFSVRKQMLIAAVIAGITLSFPLLRSAGFVPTEAIVQVAERVSAERASSLQFRFDHEAMFLEKAAERWVFGWSGNGRWRVYDGAGNDIGVSDGAWIITLAQWGLVGYTAFFSLICMPIIICAFRQARYRITSVTSGLCIVLSAHLIDQIPNASLTPLLWMLAGAILGRLESAIAEIDPWKKPDDEKSVMTWTHTSRSDEYKHSRFPPAYDRKRGT